MPVYNTCAGYGHIRATKRNALFERTEDWSLKAGDAAEGPYEDLLAWRFDAGKLAESLLAEGIAGDEDLAFRRRRGGLERHAHLRRRAREGARAVRARSATRSATAMEIMVELHGLWTLPPALRIAEALKPYDVAWLEEPIRFNELDALAELARHTAIPIAASERLATRQIFKQLIEQRAASIIMIDLAWCGGLSEARKIANMAEASELPVTLHDCTGPIVYAASCALSATLPNANWQEAVRAYYSGWYREVADVLPRVENGRVVAARRSGARAEAEAGGVDAGGRHGAGVEVVTVQNEPPNPTLVQSHAPHGELSTELSPTPGHEAVARSARAAEVASLEAIGRIDVQSPALM